MSSTQPDPLDKLKDGLRAADGAIQDANEGTLTTTLTALFLSADGTARAASIGDSVLAVLTPEHKSKGSRRPKKLGYEESTSVGSGQTKSIDISQDQLIETWWPNKEGGSAESKLSRNTYLVLMSDGISDNLKIPFIEQLLRRHPLERVAVGLPKHTRDNRALEQKKSGASTTDLGLDNMSAIVVRFDGVGRTKRPAAPRVDDASLVCAMGTYGGPAASSGGQFGLFCLAGQEGGATAAPEFLRQFFDSEHQGDVRSRLEQSWLKACPSRNQARFSVLYADDHGTSFTFANDLVAPRGVR
jgi:serine/threonine protein phosphatase PrpC